MRAIDRLTSRFPAPHDAIERGIEDSWPHMHHRIGSVLPRDYKDFINAFGSVTLGETVDLGQTIRPFNPFSTEKWRDLFWRATAILSGLRDWKEEFGPKGCPYPLWFEPGGLLPWGETTEGLQTLFWLTRGHPDQWAVVVASSEKQFHEFDGSMIDFVEAFLSRALDERFDMSCESEPAIVARR